MARKGYEMQMVKAGVIRNGEHVEIDVPLGSGFQVSKQRGVKCPLCHRVIDARKQRCGQDEKGRFAHLSCMEG